MQRENVIIIHKGDTYETWGSLTEICGVVKVGNKMVSTGQGHQEFKYSTLREKKYPFTYKGWKFIKVPHRTLAKDQQ